MTENQVDYKAEFERLRAENEKLKNNPAYRDVLLRQDYVNSPELRREFPDAETYLAFMHAKESGKTKICGDNATA
jgi:hypothetical protein